MKEDEIEEVEIIEALEQETIEDIEDDEVIENFEECIDESEEYEYDYGNDYQRKPLGRLITLVAFTAIMLVTSTYAWFSTQKNVTLNGLYGEVKVAESLQMSLDAEHWVNTINFADFDQARPGEWKVKTSSETTYLNNGATFQNPVTGVTNITPTEYFPVSTTGYSSTNDGIGQSLLKMYNGTNTEIKKLSNIEPVAEEAASGYFAFDLFLMNTSDSAVTVDDLKLDMVSDVTGINEDTGIQNTVRVALALYENNNAISGFNAATAAQGTDMTISGDNTLTPAQIIAGTSTGKKIKDIAIWEPNANKHVDAIISSNANNITFSANDLNTYGFDAERDATQAALYKFSDGQKLPTYAITSGSEGATIGNIYDWATPATGLKKQYTLQTDADTIRTEAIDLISVKKLEANAAATDTSFEIVANQYQKVRVYVWIEGQDPDCINYASLGGGLTVNLGITKGDTVTAQLPSTAETTPYLPTGFSPVAGTNLSNGLTIKDGSGNQYVWVEVPRNETIYADVGLDIELDDLTGTELTNAYTAIETDLHDYTGTGYRDVHSGDDTSTGLTSTQYTDLKYKMLKSVYENGGFYIGKYETGIVSSYRDFELTDENFVAEHPIAETAVVQANAYPYNWVRCSQAQTLATGMASGDRTSSLMFGIQWDLTLKYLESKGVDSALLYDDSTSWGNYANSTYTLSSTSEAKYNALDPDTGGLAGWTSAATTPYTHNEGDVAILSAGASESFGKMGIYDLAGNMAEWTLEYTSSSSGPCVLRGGDCVNDGGINPASGGDYGEATYSGPSVGFRPSIF